MKGVCTDGFSICKFTYRQAKIRRICRHYAKNEKNRKNQLTKGEVRGNLTKLSDTAGAAAALGRGKAEASPKKSA